MKQNSYKLQQTVVPSHYKLHLKPDLEMGNFTGEVEIDISILKDTSFIELNSLELEIIESSIGCNSGINIDTEEVILNETDERLVLKFKNNINVGLYKLKIHFKGELNDLLHGFYKSKFKDDFGVEHIMQYGLRGFIFTDVLH